MMAHCTRELSMALGLPLDCPHSPKCPRNASPTRQHAAPASPSPFAYPPTSSFLPPSPPLPFCLSTRPSLALAPLPAPPDGAPATTEPSPFSDHGDVIDLIPGMLCARRSRLASVRPFLPAVARLARDTMQQRTARSACAVALAAVLLTALVCIAPASAFTKLYRPKHSLHVAPHEAHLAGEPVYFTPHINSGNIDFVRNARYASSRHACALHGSPALVHGRAMGCGHVITLTCSSESRAAPSRDCGSSRRMLASSPSTRRRATTCTRGTFPRRTETPTPRS